ncbi:MAG: hypothetical protein MK078_12055 [Crocinitomicaceae bacterium]|nr:hypothetical protein [Crocinitomicaceae bacterium]
MSDLSNTYLFKALDNYPYDLPETIEALNYALSYDDKNPTALCLMGKIYAEQLKDFDAARYYYEEALSVKPDALDVIPNLIRVMIWSEDFNDALKLIEYALNIKGSDKGNLWYDSAIVHEHKLNYKKSLKCLKKAKQFGFNSDFISFIETNEKRIKDKMPKKRKKKNK